MHRLRSLVLLVALVVGACSRGAGPAPTVDPSSARTTPAGPVIGFAGDAGEHVWRGLPYAQPPTGARRWRAPQPLSPWQETRQALAFGSPCPQYASPLGGVPGKDGSVVGNEDCLYLNVYAPRFAAGEVPTGAQRLPVMLWIHGGGNSIGEAGFYHPGKLAADERVIVVTTNYRLGPLGWMRHAALREGASPAEQSGNFATLDLIAALRWVHDNVAAFGGNPDNVTIFGESAGGQNAFSLLLAPPAKGLFHRAISQSGGLWMSSPAQAEHFTDDAEPGDAHSSNEVLLALLQRDGAADRAAARSRLAAMSPAQVADYLRGKSATQLLAVYEPYPGNGMIEMPKVFRDGTVLPVDDPMARFARADGWNHVPVMLGTNHDENRLFMFGDPHWVKRYFWIVPRLLNEPLYVVTSEYLARNWKATGADMPAAAMRGNADDVYVYRFDWNEQPHVLGADLSVMLGASHGFEIPFVFDHFDLGPQGNVMWTDDNEPGREQLSAAMMGYWAEFARNGRPGRGGSDRGVEWLAWDPSAPAAPKYLVLDTAAGGGIRMSDDAVTLDRLRSDLASDPRLTDPRDRCAVYHEISRWGRGFTRTDYDAAAECKPFPYEQYPWG
ncbi:MAG TPA: carboxylesterase family protein [Candidatus Dormibacteraeota bacterium]|nr:carboxylesterase family protein [Candidatus Dormibacteraeota bacterium]